MCSLLRRRMRMHHHRQVTSGWWLPFSGFSYVLDPHDFSNKESVLGFPFWPPSIEWCTASRFDCDQVFGSASPELYQYPWKVGGTPSSRVPTGNFGAFRRYL